MANAKSSGGFQGFGTLNLDRSEIILKYSQSDLVSILVCFPLNLSLLFAYVHSFPLNLSILFVGLCFFLSLWRPAASVGLNKTRVSVFLVHGDMFSPWIQCFICVCVLSAWRPAASVGQRDAGRHRQIPAPGGNWEDGREESPDRGERTLLLLRVHAPAHNGQSSGDSSRRLPDKCEWDRALCLYSFVSMQEEEMSLLGEISHLQTLSDDLKTLTMDPHKLPPSSEQVTLTWGPLVKCLWKMSENQFSCLNSVEQLANVRMNLLICFGK